MNIIETMPDRDWLQSHAYEVYKALNLGPVEVQVMRANDDAVVMIALPKQMVGDQTAVSAFRFKAGRGLRDQIKRAYRMAAKELEQKIEKQRAQLH